MSDSFINLEQAKQKLLMASSIVQLPDVAQQSLRNYLEELLEQIFLKNPRLFTKYRNISDDDIEFLLDKLEEQTEQIRTLKNKLKKNFA